MRPMKNRRIALIACAVCVALSVLGLGGMKLRSKAAALEKTFVYGTDPELVPRHSMDEYLDRAAQSAKDLAQEAKRHLDGDAPMASVAAYADQLARSEGMSGRYELYLSLTDAVEELYSSLQAAGAADAVNVSVAYHDFASTQNLIKNDGYRAEATKYNAVLKAFPANAIAALWGIDKADAYGW